MWKQWTNVVVGIFTIIATYSSAGIGWIVTGVAVIVVISFWSALEIAGSESRTTAHA